MRARGSLRGAAVAILSVAVAALLPMPARPKHAAARALQRDFAADPESWAAHLYLSSERMSIH
jgi:hypothetical protein